MNMKRRAFLNKSALGAGATFLIGANACTSDKEKSSVLDDLQSMTTDVVPITLEERKHRIEKAQRLMVENGISALLLDAGTSLKYFTAIDWWLSERPMVAIIPSVGEVSYVCPGFEEDRLRENITIGNKVYPWQEDESPYQQIILALKEMGITSGKIGIEERVRFFVSNGVKTEAPYFDYVSGDSVSIPCRMIKSEAEIALMQKATDITIEAIKVGFHFLREDSSPADFYLAVEKAHQKLGAQHSFASVNFAEASAFPHGSGRPQVLKKGDVVLVDCGCIVEGYSSDISRTIVFGAEPNQRQREIWNLEKKAQAAGFAAAKIGRSLEEVDVAARKVISDAGMGPEYKLPGLPHRTGHGIGMDVHEWGNAVKGNRQLIEPGMCFSIEPTIAIPGEFGIRLEDCVYMTESGPKWFSEPSPSIDQPFV